MQDRLMDFSETEHRMCINMVSGYWLQLTFKTLPLVK